MNDTETIVLDNREAPPGAAGPLAEQQETTIAISTVLNDFQNVAARLLAGWRASLERQGQLEAALADATNRSTMYRACIGEAIARLVANQPAITSTTREEVIDYLREQTGIR